MEWETEVYTDEEGNQRIRGYAVLDEAEMNEAGIPQPDTAGEPFGVVEDVEEVDGELHATVNLNTDGE